MIIICGLIRGYIINIRRSIIMKFVCTVCGYVHEGDAAPDFCPVCKAPAEKFKAQEGEMTWASE